MLCSRALLLIHLLTPGFQLLSSPPTPSAASSLCLCVCFVVKFTSAVFQVPRVSDTIYLSSSV